MIGGVLIFVCTIMVIEFFVEWIRSLLDESNAEDAMFCYNCPLGFCMETPGSQKCKELRGDK